MTPAASAQYADGASKVKSDGQNVTSWFGSLVSPLSRARRRAAAHRSTRRRSSPACSIDVTRRSSSRACCRQRLLLASRPVLCASPHRSAPQYVVNQLVDKSSVDLLVLRELLARMGGAEVFDDMREAQVPTRLCSSSLLSLTRRAQLLALSGGELLRTLGAPPPSMRPIKKSSLKLLQALVNRKLVPNAAAQLVADCARLPQAVPLVVLVAQQVRRRRRSLAAVDVARRRSASRRSSSRPRLRISNCSAISLTRRTSRFSRCGRPRRAARAKRHRARA